MISQEMEERLKSFKTAEEEVAAMTRRIVLMEQESQKAETALADTVTKLAISSKEADGILKKVKFLKVGR
jgi:repressor of nif and glnA expression